MTCIYDIKKIFSFILFLSIVTIFQYKNTVAQELSETSTAKRSWTTNNPFQTDVFVENFGQFNNWVKTSEPIKFVLNSSDKIFFTQTGLTIKLEKYVKVSRGEFEEKKQKESIETRPKIETYYVSMQWENCNTINVIAEGDPTENYYTFGEKGYEQIKAKGYKKLTYKNLYDGIDVEYIIPDKGGIKYSLIIHPGADVSKVKMKYTGDIDKIEKDKDGNIQIKTPAGTITDHAPSSFYEDNNNSIFSSFELNENIISFQLPAFGSQLKTIIIDPWTTTPSSMTTNNVAYDIGYDDYGSVYISGGVYPFKLAKYSSSGNLLWTFTNPSGWDAAWGCYSKFCILPFSGTIFLGEGFNPSAGPRMMKIKSDGTLLVTSPNFAGMEIWVMFYNCYTAQLIGFGGGTAVPDNLQVISDTNLTSSNVHNFNGYNDIDNDIAAAEMDYNGDFFALMSSMISSNNNHIIKSLLSANYYPPNAFDINTGYLFNECSNLGIPGFSNWQTVRANALTLNDKFLYGYDGQTIKVWEKTTGSMLGSVVTNAAYANGESRTHEGITVDECNNVYVGGNGIVHVYNFDSISYTFTPLTSITTNISGEVYDLRLNKSTYLLYVCGNGFVTETTALPCNQITLSTIIDTCAGDANVAVVSGGTPPYSYLWSNGATTANVTGLAPGIYTVTISDSNVCAPRRQVDTVTITIAADAGTDQIICLGQSANLTAFGGISYIWSDSSASQNINVSPSITTTYTVTVTHAGGCTASDDVLVTVNPLPPANAGIDQTICYTNSATLNASGGTSYQWSPSATLSDSLIANPVANTLTTTTYAVTVTDANNCSATDNITLTVLLPLSLDVTANPALICLGESTVLTAAPGGGNSHYTYTWDNGIGISTQSVTVSPAQTTMYHVTLTDDCGTPAVVDSVQVIVFPLPVVQFIPDTLSGCQPLTVDFTDNTTPAITSWDWDFGDDASGGNNGSTQQTPAHTYNDAGIYTVSLAVITTNGCAGNDTLHNIIEVYEMPDADFEINPMDATMENPLIQFIDQSTYSYTWDWNFGDPASGLNNTSVLQNPVHIYSDSGTYTIFLTVLTDHGCMDTIQKNLTVKEIFTFYVPNAFTPNDDGDNDYFFPKGVGWDPNNYEMDIFDRWGSLIYHTNTIGNSWNGTVHNNGSWSDALIDVYVYLIRVKEINGPRHEFVGRVTLVR